MRPQIVDVLDVLKTAQNKVPSYMAAWLDNDPNIVHLLEIDLGEEKPLCERLGVSKGVFPPVENLEDEEVEILVQKIQELWEAYHYIADLPPGISSREAYQALLHVWEEPVMMFATGRWHFDFCDLDLANQD